MLLLIFISVCTYFHTTGLSKHLQDVFSVFFEFLAAMFCHSHVQLPVDIADPRHLALDSFNRFDLSILQQVGD
jgi:hypothetical protein